MDAKTPNLALLASLSLFLAGAAWILGHLVLGSVFFALGVVAAVGRGTGSDMALLIRRPAGHRGDDDYGVLSEGEVVGRIMKVIAAPEDAPWMWSLGYGHHSDRSPTHGFKQMREAAMTA